MDSGRAGCLKPDGSQRIEWIRLGSSLKFAFSSGELLSFCFDVRCPVFEGIVSSNRFRVFVFDLIGNREVVVLGTLSIEIHVHSAAFCERTEAEPS